MNTTILTLDQREMDQSVDISNRENYYMRNAVRAVFIDHSGRIALIYAGQRGYYKLPGGGVDDGEVLSEALTRELIEETGSEANIGDELGRVVEWRDFCKMKQTSYAFRASLVGEPGIPQLTESEIEEEFALHWIDTIDEAIKLVEANVDHEDIEVVFMSRRDAAILRAAQQ